ncbi:uncharacterized protein F5Z01DRAFT_697825 [Emericellopsis atlantica]|uniref:CFEM domain-containing protein n=1 Tax=Emericellopsis atlantica TaxID=2614577 RepID=A0A9P8CJM8_9HYPO|nr:uncharacterized protein F5Z01DRAFT_697825 [Emericellopsis atlantica]KAG9249508.1 hypothetical protein F5Z01DRAFT_697825 [Emericellopsis atlantica]
MEQSCDAADLQCICASDTLRAYLGACVGVACTPAEALSARNITTALCHSSARSRSGQLVVVASTMTGLAVAFATARLVCRQWVVGSSLWLDDWLALGATGTIIASAFINIYGLAGHGLGRDIWTLSAGEITAVLRYFHTIAWLYFLDTALVKLSVIVFYLRIFPTVAVQRLLWGTFAVTCIWGATFIFVAVFQCRPIDHFWKHWDGMHQGSCVDANAVAWASAATNIALDLWLLAVPLWQLRTLQLHRKKKIGVGLMFCVGIFVTVVSALRLQSLVTFAKTSNMTWDYYPACLWSTIEVTVGLMCACFPAVRQLLVKGFPRLGESCQLCAGVQNP